MKPERSWLRKFGDAARGVRLGIQGERSFLVHFPVAAAVVALACFFQVDPGEWCLLVGCIFAVLTAELFNSSVESLAQAVDREHNPTIGKSLDNASGAVLISCIGAAAIGLIVFVPRILAWLGE